MDLTPQCEMRLKAHYLYELLERLNGAAEIIGQCSGEIWREPDAFDLVFPGTAGPLMLRWCASAPTAGIAILRDQNNTYSLSLLASGLDAAADNVTLAAFQQHVVRQLRNTQYEPAFDLIELWQRPLVATIGLLIPPAQADRQIFAMADRCFAAAYFRRLGLV